MPSTCVTTSGRVAKRYLSAIGSDSTHWRIGCRGNTSSMAAIRNQLLRLTRIALDAKKSVLKQTALEIGFELVFDVPRQRSPFGHATIPELRIVLGHELIEQRRFRPVSPVPRRRDEALRLRNVSVRRDHAVRPCTALRA